MVFPEDLAEVASMVKAMVKDNMMKENLSKYIDLDRPVELKMFIEHDAQACHYPFENEHVTSWLCKHFVSTFNV